GAVRDLDVDPAGAAERPQARLDRPEALLVGTAGVLEDVAGADLQVEAPDGPQVELGDEVASGPQRDAGGGERRRGLGGVLPYPDAERADVAKAPLGLEPGVPVDEPLAGAVVAADEVEAAVDLEADHPHPVEHQQVTLEH